MAASSSRTRWRLACDTCPAAAVLGPAPDGFDAWCEACQTAQRLAAGPGTASRCRHCGTPLFATPRFVELWGELQNVDAVLAAWTGDPAPLAAILPERPRFITDLTPPEAHAGDPPARAAVIAAVTHGDWRGALAAADADPRTLAARAIAHERLGDPAAAIAEWSRLLATRGDERARLARGSLWARAGEMAAAARDLAFAGDAHAARWNRAALLVHEAVRTRDGRIDLEALANARAAAGTASAYWSDPTVGRLLWSLLVERLDAIDENALATLRAAEGELEHDTFWDRAMLLAGWVRLGQDADAARVAEPLAAQELTALRTEPALAGAALGPAAAAIDAARAEVASGAPAAARTRIASLLARNDLRRFRIPCTACGRGTVGVEETIEHGEPEERAAV